MARSTLLLVVSLCLASSPAFAAPEAGPQRATFTQRFRAGTLSLLNRFKPTPRAQTRLDRAYLMASQLHRTQVRKGTTTPYLAHLMGVASTTMEAGGTEDHAIAALLHDAVEDQGGAKTLRRIENEFGPRIAHLVLGLSDSVEIEKPAWRGRKEQYLEHLAKSDDDVRLISLADKLYNARSIVREVRVNGDATFAKFSGGKSGVLWYYRSLVGTYEKTSSKGSPTLDELRRSVAEMHQLAGTSMETAP